MAWAWDAYPPWLEYASSFLATSVPSFLAAAFTLNSMAWRTLVHPRVSSLDITILTPLPPTWVVRKAFKGS